ncbi:hypothetical protein DLM76_08465 [Leptospira yasudae]|nr:hypothetical protein DLM76_08465 [Leptospira yasudae]
MPASLGRIAKAFLPFIPLYRKKESIEQLNFPYKIASFGTLKNRIVPMDVLKIYAGADRL